MKVHVLTSHRPAGRMEIRGVYEDPEDANRIGAMTATMRVETFELIPSSRATGHQDAEGEPSSTGAGSSA